MRITIGHKIFAVACVLLMLMLCSALLSTWKLRQASSEADAVAHYFMPLANRIGNVQAHLLQQEIIVQRILRDVDVPNAHGQSIDAHLAEFDDFGARVDAEIVEAIRLADMAVAGKSEPMRVFELLSLAGGLSEARESARAAFAAGLAAYRAGDWSGAEAGFKACLDHDRDDGPARVFLERLAFLRARPPADSWDGIWHLTTKGGL